MTLAAWLAAIAGAGAIVGGVVYVIKLAIWKATPTPQERKEQIDHAVNEEERKAKETGRP